MSDQDNNIFNNQSAATQTTDASTGDNQEPSSNVEPFADLLGSIKTEDGRQKFNDVNSALNSIPHAQTHISKLEEENAAIKAELEKRKTAEELLESMKQNQSGTGQEPPSSPQLDEAQLAALVDSRLTLQQTQAIQSENIGKVTSKLTELYGDKAEDTLYSAASELGLSNEYVRELAATSPDAVLKLVGVNGNVQPAPDKSSSSINTDALTPRPASQPNLKFDNAKTANDYAEIWRSA